MWFELIKIPWTSFEPKPHLKFWSKFKNPSPYTSTFVLPSFGPDLGEIYMILGSL